ncbi:hypothetical protein IFR05_017029 [Cadophora sp. M221]|nr:hypothetical protein IFR05_017029 [Cadophora sp. M221]
MSLLQCACAVMETIAKIAELNGTADDRYHPQVHEIIRRLETKLENGLEATLHHNGSSEELLNQAWQLIQSIATKAIEASAVPGTTKTLTNESNIGSSSVSIPSLNTQPPGDSHAAIQKGGGGGDGAVPIPSAPDAVHPSSAMSATDHVDILHLATTASTNIPPDTRCTRGLDPGYRGDGGDGTSQGVERHREDEAPQSTSQNSIYSQAVPLAYLSTISKFPPNPSHQPEHNVGLSSNNIPPNTQGTGYQVKGPRTEDVQPTVNSPSAPPQIDPPFAISEAGNMKAVHNNLTPGDEQRERRCKSDDQSTPQNGRTWGATVGVPVGTGINIPPQIKDGTINTIKTSTVAKGPRRLNSGPT